MINYDNSFFEVMHQIISTGQKDFSDKVCTYVGNKDYLIEFKVNIKEIKEDKGDWWNEPYKGESEEEK